MKMLACAIAASCLVLSARSVAQSLKPSHVIDLVKVKIAASTCKGNLPSDFSNIQWVDDSRLLASTYWAHCDAISTDPEKFETQAVLFDISGTILATDHSHASLYTKGPHGTVANSRQAKSTFWMPKCTPSKRYLARKLRSRAGLLSPNHQQLVRISRSVTLPIKVSRIATSTRGGQLQEFVRRYSP